MRIEDALLRCKEVSIHNSDTPGLDSRVLIAHLTGRSQAWVLAHPKDIFPSELEVKLFKALNHLKAGVPLPYVLGVWEFYNLIFEIKPDVLIPRPETEILVEEALTWLKARPGARQVADIGTGSGCIAISLAHQVCDLKVIATDISASALTIAQSNAVRHRVNDRIHFVHANLLEPLTASALQMDANGFDLIVANLPYIPTDVLHSLKVFQHEPLTALDGGQDGLDLIRKLLEVTPPVLKPEGLILFEIEANQGENAIELTQAQFPNAEVSLHLDLSGHDRLVRIQT